MPLSQKSCRKVNKTQFYPLVWVFLGGFNQFKPGGLNWVRFYPTNPDFDGHWANWVGLNRLNLLYYKIETAMHCIKQNCTLIDCLLKIANFFFSNEPFLSFSELQNEDIKWRDIHCRCLTVCHLLYQEMVSLMWRVSLFKFILIFNFKLPHYISSYGDLTCFTVMTILIK